MMQLNAMFPTRDVGNDPAKIRDWAQAAEDLGYAYIEVPDHVFGATAREGWTPLYNEKDPFHETFVMLGFLAALRCHLLHSHPKRRQFLVQMLDVTVLHISLPYCWGIPP
ncbi:MAG: hypothetical protein ACXWC3_13700, partial [Burkholderiales bacterium]